MDLIIRERGLIFLQNTKVNYNYPARMRDRGVVVRRTTVRSVTTKKKKMYCIMDLYVVVNSLSACYRTP